MQEQQQYNYTLTEKPVDGFSRVLGSNGRWGLLNLQTKKEVIPCDFLNLIGPYSDRDPKRFYVAFNNEKFHTDAFFNKRVYIA